MTKLVHNVHTNHRPPPLDMRPSAIAARAKANGLKSLSEVELNELMTAVGQGTQAPTRPAVQPQVNASPERVEAAMLALNLSLNCKLGMTVPDYLNLGLPRLRALESERKALQAANAMNPFEGYDFNDPSKLTARETALNKLQSKKSWLGYDLNDPLGESK